MTKFAVKEPELKGYTILTATTADEAIATYKQIYQLDNSFVVTAEQVA